MSQWLGVLAVITMMMTLVPLGSAAPAEAISGTNTRDENVLRTTGVSRVTYNTGGTCGTTAVPVVGCGGGPLTNNGVPEGYSPENVETNSIAELDTGVTIGDQFPDSAQTRVASGDLADSQIVRIRATFFKNATNVDLPTGGASRITNAYVVLIDRSTKDFAYIKVRRGGAGWDNGVAAINGTGDDGLVVFCRDPGGQRKWATNYTGVFGAAFGQGGGTPVVQFDEPPISDPANAANLFTRSAAGVHDRDTPPVSCGAGGRPFLSSLQFSSDITGPAQYGISGNANDILTISVMYAHPTPEAEGPIDIYTAVEDQDNFADGNDFYASVQMGDIPTVTGAPFTGVGSSSVRSGSNLDIFVSAEDKDSEGDIRAVQAFLVNASGAYVEIQFYHKVQKNYGTPGTPGTGTSITSSDFEDRYQLFDGNTGRYVPNKPTDTGTLTSSMGTLDVSSSSFSTSGDRVTVTFKWTPNASSVGVLRLFAQGVDREMQKSGLQQAASFTVTAS